MFNRCAVLVVDDRNYIKLNVQIKGMLDHIGIRCLDDVAALTFGQERPGLSEFSGFSGFDFDDDQAVLERAHQV